MNTDTLYYLGAQLEGPLVGREKWVVPKRVYHFPIRWDDCEKQKGVITFPQWAYETISSLDGRLGHDNYQLVIGVKTTPEFYSLPPHARNSPPTPEHYQDYARFCEAVSETFNPYALEIWNEPEFSVAESSKWQEYFGGFGLDGASYGRMVKETWECLLGTNTKIIAGASFGLVDVDRSLKFLKDAVGAGMVADYYSWHAYWKYSDVLYGQRDFYQALWFADKAFDIFPVKQVISETSIRRDTWREELTAHRLSQADLLKFYLKYMAESPIESILWYTLADNLWEHTDLAAKDIIYPAYLVWRDYQV